MEISKGGDPNFKWIGEVDIWAPKNWGGELLKFFFFFPSFQGITGNYGRETFELAKRGGNPNLKKNWGNGKEGGSLKNFFNPPLIIWEIYFYG